MRRYIDGMRLTPGSNFTECLNGEMASKLLPFCNPMEPSGDTNTAYVEWFRGQNV